MRGAHSWNGARSGIVTCVDASARPAARRVHAQVGRTVFALELERPRNQHDEERPRSGLGGGDAHARTVTQHVSDDH
jgi:hypothetical protein